MPTALGTLLNDLIIKSGVPSDNADLKSILSNPELSKIELPDALATPLQSNLMSEQAAKAKLSAQIKAEAFDGVDAEYFRIADEKQLADDFKTNLKAEKSTVKKAKMLADEIARVTETLHKSKGTGKEADLIAEVNTLKASMQTLKSQADAEKASIQSTFDKKIFDLKLDNYLSNYSYALGDIPKSVQLRTARALFEEQLASGKAKVSIDDVDSFKLTSATGTDYLDEKNNIVDFKTFVERSITPIVKKNDGSNGGSDDVGNSRQQFNPGAQHSVNTNALERLQGDLAMLQQ